VGRRSHCRCVRTWMCTTGCTPNARVTFEGDSWLLRRVFFPYEGAVRHTPLEKVGTGNGRVGMLRGGEGLRVGVTRNDPILLWSGHGK